MRAGELAQRLEIAANTREDLRANGRALLDQIGRRRLHRRRHREIGVGDDFVRRQRLIDLRRGPAESDPAKFQLRQPGRLRQSAEAEGQHLGAGKHVVDVGRRIERVVGKHFVADDRPAAGRGQLRQRRRDRRDAETSPSGCSATRSGSRARDRSPRARSNRRRCATSRDTRARRESR